MKSEYTLVLVAFFLSFLRVVDYYKHILDTKDVSNISIKYTILGLISSLIFLYIQLKHRENIFAGMLSITIALELYVLYILTEREFKYNSIKPEEIKED